MSTPNLALVLGTVTSLWLPAGLLRVGKPTAAVLERRRAPQPEAQPRLHGPTAA